MNFTPKKEKKGKLDEGGKGRSRKWNRRAGGESEGGLTAFRGLNPGMGGGGGKESHLLREADPQKKGGGGEI